MKFRKSSVRTTESLPELDAEKGRRRLLLRSVAGMAAFATSFFVSGRVHADEDCGCGGCSPSPGECLVSWGLCYSEALEHYVVRYAVWSGTASPSGCCNNQNSFVCDYFCTTTFVC